MKKVFKAMLAATLILTAAVFFTACGNSQTDESSSASRAESTKAESENAAAESAEDSAAESEAPAESAGDGDETSAANSIVVYFSCTGNTRSAAEAIAEVTGADIYEIVPAEPYTSDDIDYSNDNCRANTEMNDPSARPAIGSEALDLSQYDTVYIGYPIWWGTKPRIIDTFLDEYDLAGKVVMPFCTSGSSGIEQSVSEIREAEPNADVMDGLRVADTGDGSIESWVGAN